MTLIKSYICAVFVVLVVLKAGVSIESPVKIAIVGGGIGGTSAAYFLEELFGDELLLDLYEPKEIGGRLAIRKYAGNYYEVGGSIIHPRNYYMSKFVKDFGLGVKTGCPGRYGLFDGSKYVLVESSSAVMNMLKLFWRYGMDIVWLHRLIERLLSQFENIYSHHSNGHAFVDLKQLLSSMNMDFLNMMNETTREFLTTYGLREDIINELVTAAIRVNYGQMPEFPALVGMVAMAGASGDLWSVAGGNKRVCEELLKRSRAIHLHRKVVDISPHNGNFLVWSEEEEDRPVPQEYNVVIVATPLTADTRTLRLVNFTESFDFPGRYEHIVCTMVEGELSKETFRLEENTAEIDEILVINSELSFNSIGRQSPVDDDTCPEGRPEIFKIFSPKRLSPDQLDRMFSHHSSVDVVEWLAYPHYSVGQQLGKFELNPGLYYLSAIEAAASAMEMSAISAKNAALLAVKYVRHLQGHSEPHAFQDEL